MHASFLARLLRSAVSSTLPLGAAAAAAAATSGCCGDYVRSEVREIAALPSGWSIVEGVYVHDGKDKAFYGSPKDDDIEKDDCAILCGERVDGCQFVLDCEGPVLSGEGGSGGEGGFGGEGGSSGEPGENLHGCDPESGQTPYQFLVLCNATYGATCGRRPAGFFDCPSPGSGAGAYFATLARLEAASVHAFLALCRELRAHRAPAPLLRAAARAAADEVRHARAMTALARRFGGRVYSPSSPPPAPPRPLLDVAAENAREGCVRETYGAALALWQSQRAGDPRVRAAFRAVAADEIRHAALAWRVHAWARPRLPARARLHLDRTLTAAREELSRELAIEPPPDLARIAGAPTARAAGRLATEIAGRLPAPLLA